MEWMDAAFQTDSTIEASLRKGIGYFDLLMFDHAVEFLRSVVQQANHPLGRLYLAAAYAENKEAELARAQLAELRRSTTDVLVLSAANEIEAHLWAQDKRYDESIRLLAQVASQLPRYPDVWYNLGLCFALLGQHTKAISCLTKALDLAPDDKDAGHLLALIQLKTGQRERAWHTVSYLLAHHPSGPAVLLLKSELAILDQRYDEGFAALRQILQIDPFYDAAWAQLAKGLLQKGEAEEAVGVLKKALSLNPNHPASLVQLGIAYLFSGQTNRAEHCIMSSMSTYPDKSFLWLILGRVCALQNDTAKAYRRYLRAMRDERKPIKRLALYLYGLSLFEEGRSVEAEKYLKAAQVLGTPNTAITLLLARTAEHLGRPLEAERLMASVYPGQA
ncbi:MAG: hypothetical protein A2201_03140 [Alicyclobacillus sp. RIFOXYA1_FULL_53_8]|nr:MAG: hypothetical protein A2201_03140 [Alicyclobacillus sp. RIFOXYA1_FULL_53_8]